MSISKYINWIIKPIEDNFFLSILLYISIAVPDIYNCFVGYAHTNWHLAINLVFVSYVYAYILILILSLLPDKISCVFKILLYIVSFLHLIINILCINTYHQLFDSDIAAVIKGSNWGEIHEYLLTYSTIINILLVIFLLLSMCLSYIFLDKLKIQLNRFIKVPIVLLLFVAVLASIRRPAYFNQLFISKYLVFFSLESVPDLHNYKTNPIIEYNSDYLPDNIVMVIGESFSKSHSSLYGYSKMTNPELSGLQRDSLLYVFNNIKAPAINTINCFKSIMSTYSPEDKDSIPWYSCTTLIECMHEIGYNTVWISNQSKKGLYDNIIGAYSSLCNEEYYVGDMYAGLHRRNLDEGILPVLENRIVESDGCNMFFVHLMGSHPAFSHRYPDEFKVFKADDYNDKPENQRGVLSEYDNSILYNDYVVNCIFNLFDNEEAVIFYFSDHGLDVFNTSDDYIGHARKTEMTSVKYGLEIPFMIYATEKYRNNYPNEILRIERSLENEFCTDAILYSMLDLIGARLVDDRNVEKSLLSKSVY